MSEPAAATYIGQVERDPDGDLWAVLYCGELAISRERVRSLRKGKRRVADLVLGACDSWGRKAPAGPPTHMNRLVERRVPTAHHRPASSGREPELLRGTSVGAVRPTQPALAP